jgi:hypothetical protein
MMGEKDRFLPLFTCFYLCVCVCVFYFVFLQFSYFLEISDNQIFGFVFILLVLLDHRPTLLFRNCFNFNKICSSEAGMLGES